MCLSGYFHLLQPKAEINTQKTMAQKALDACLCCKIFCFAFLFSQLLDSLSLEKRKGNQDLRESSIPRLWAIEVIKRKKGEKKKQNPFFLLKFLGKEYKELNTFELRPNMKHAKLPSVDHHHPTGLDTWNLLTNRVRKMVGKHN